MQTALFLPHGCTSGRYPLGGGHIQKNSELYDFELTDEEMERINALDRNEKHDWY